MVTELMALGLLVGLMVIVSLIVKGKPSPRKRWLNESMEGLYRKK